jgi:acyl dehydratase
MTLLHFEDFSPGQTLALDNRYAVTKEEIVAFAKRYDPQPHHLDEDAAKKTILGGLAASGWHVCAMAMRMIVDGLVTKAAAQGAAGVEECRWLKPVRPGDVLRLELEVLETRAPTSRDDIGFVKIRWDVFNQSERVAMMVSSPMFLRRKA